MTSKQVIELMLRQIPYDEKTLSDLQNLVEEYPYFQTAQLLYTLNLHLSKDSRFNAELRKAACHAGDRKKLFYLIEDELFSPVIDKNQENKENIVANTSFDLIDFFLAEKAEEIKRKAENPDTQIVSTDYMSYFLSEEAQKQEIETFPLQHQETIDKFLEKDEIFPFKLELKDKGDEEIFSPDLKTVDKDDFFSETLAKIYLKQKKYEKALEIIRKLSLHYPEKSLYFADQIRFLEKLVINSKK
ncbi:MAG: tetratricopeptide repeat protein [Dysgonamonadaceae bacterium]|nr:tetratricopeptide repeat protein [Dysgonamonadaceae bacterium]